MTITEANAVNKLLSTVLAVGDPVPYDDLRAAAVLLAGKAHKALAAGLTSDQVQNLMTQAVAR